ncbi:hypothetical protein ScalyP_jg6778 [Parmales sp. scaly parma]|nr:hypothetical protein ScalyP_jg6778 [Parmales sp. scaly parma]
MGQVISTLSVTLPVTPPLAHYIETIRGTLQCFYNLVHSFTHLIFILAIPFVHVLVDGHQYRSRRFLLLEFISILFFLAAYLLRQHIIRRQYIPKITKRFRLRRAKILLAYKTWYDGKILALRKVSTLLAVTLPHLLFFGGCYVLIKCFPVCLKWLSRESYLVWAVSVGLPAIGSVGVLVRGEGEKNGVVVDGEIKSPFRPGGGAMRFSKPVSTPTTTAATTTAANVTVTVTALATKTKTKATKSPPKTPKSPKTSKITAKSPPKSPKSYQTISEPNSTLESDISSWLAYWVVYATTITLHTLLSTVPVLSTIYNYSPNLLSFGPECRMFFFVWLHVPEMGATGIVHRFAAKWVGKFVLSEDVAVTFISLHFPSLITSINSLTETNNNQSALTSFIPQSVRNLISHLLFALKILREWVGLLPAICTLFMPSFITSYGVLYASAVVPSANSLRENKNDSEHWLRYWVSFAILQSVLEAPAVAFLLGWTPFSTHAVLVLYIYMQQRKWGGAEVVYFFIINELVGMFGGEVVGVGRERVYSARWGVSGRVKRAFTTPRVVDKKGGEKVLVKEDLKLE